MDLYRRGIDFLTSKKGTTTTDSFEEDGILHSLLAEELRVLGQLYKAEGEAVCGVQISRQEQDDETEIWGLIFLGLTFAARNPRNKSEKVFKRALALEEDNGRANAISVYDNYAMSAIWSAQFSQAYKLAVKAKVLYQEVRIKYYSYKRRFIRSLWLQGLAALNLGRLNEADECLHQALVEARELNQLGEEIPTRIWLAELRRCQNNAQAARELLDLCMKQPRDSIQPLPAIPCAIPLSAVRAAFPGRIRNSLPPNHCASWEATN